MSLPDSHPDGDPFAARDAERDAGSWLGRLEARARLQEQSDAHSDAHERQTSEKQRSATAHTLGQDAPSSELVSSPVPTSSKKKVLAKAVVQSTAAGRPVQSLGRDSHGKEILIVDTDNEEEAGTAAQSPAAGPSVVVPDDEDEEMDGDDASGQDGDGDGEDDGSGTEADDATDEEDDGTPQVDAAEEDEEEDESEDDSDDDDTNSMTSETAPRVKREVVDDAEGEAGLRQSPQKKATDGDTEMKEGEEAAGEEGGENGETTEKKKRRRRQQRTPTPPPTGPKERRATVRLSIALPPRKDDAAPDFNINQLAKDAGFVKEDEPAKEGDEDGDDESESDGQGGRRKKVKEKASEADAGTPGAAGEGEPPKKRRKRGPNVVLGRFGGYDVNDPFVDDAEVALYEPRYAARPKREGYFVCAGEVEVVARRGRVKGSKNKPKVDENGNPIAPAARRRSGKVVMGSDGKPVAEGSEAGPSGAPSPALAGVPSFGAPAGPPPPKQRKKGEFSPELQQKLDHLKEESDKEPWIVKNKFPPHLKEELVHVAYFALDIGEYDDEFYAVMPKIFPYNLFTMKKLIKREVFSKRMQDLDEEQEEQFRILRQAIDRAYGPQRADYERRLAEYEKRLAEGDGTTATGAPVSAVRKTPEPAGGPVFGNSPAITTPLIATVDGADGSPAPGKEESEDKGAEEPKWRFRFDEQMRAALYKASEIEDKKGELIVEKQTLENSTKREINREKPYSSKSARKVLYEKLLDLWPAGGTNSNQLSREISNYKLKLKKQGEIVSGP
ncbi:hypothetical protein JCM8202_000711 [Rhodotorula sphaerocarpa]